MFKKLGLKLILIVVGILFIILCIAIAIFAKAAYKQPKTQPSPKVDSKEESKTPENPKFTKYTKSLPSRAWMEYSMDIVREEKPTPPESSRFYAYVSVAYATSLENELSDRGAGESVAQVINQIYPERASTTEELLEYIHPFDTQKYGSGALIDGKRRVVMNEAQNKAIEEILQREKTDGFYDLKWDEVIPKGEGKWIKLAQAPFSPTAGKWKRWIVTTDFKVPEPPKIGSNQDKEEIEKVRKASIARSAEQSAIINFWGGVPGTEAPAGIWQNRMYDEIVKKDKKNLTDLQYAKYQSILSQSLADSFMECWKVKYTYWTARPSMRIENLNIAMNNPNFPSYVSGHSTISRTAAEVLGGLFPEKKDLWLKDAQNARDSRLWAGIHFDVDNQEGFKLGEQIGKEIMGKIDLTELTIDKDVQKNFIKSGKLQPKLLSESHLNKAETKGNLLIASLNSDNSKEFLVSLDNKELNNFKADGWTVESVGRDAIWMPGACSSMPMTFTGRNIVMFEAELGEGPSGVEENPKTRLISYNIDTQKFSYLFEVESSYTASADMIFSYTLRNAGNKKISYLFIPKENTKLVKKQFTDDKVFINKDLAYLIKREINVETGEYKDYKIQLNNWNLNDPVYSINFASLPDKFFIKPSVDGDTYYPVENNEVLIDSPILADNIYSDEIIVGDYKMISKYVNPGQSGASTIRVLNKNNEEYFKTETDGNYSWKLEGNSKDKIFMSKTWQGAAAVSHSEIGYIDINTKKYIEGIKVPIEKVSEFGTTYEMPKYTFFLLGSL